MFDPPQPESDWSSKEKKALETMKRCKKVYLELFQRGANIKQLGEPGIVVDPAARMEKWSDNLGNKWKGPRMPDGKRQGICRVVGPIKGIIALMQMQDDKQHGLSIIWFENGNLSVELYKKNKCIGFINWKDDWTELLSSKPSRFDGVLSIDDFRP